MKIYQALLVGFLLTTTFELCGQEVDVSKNKVNSFRQIRKD